MTDGEREREIRSVCRRRLQEETDIERERERAEEEHIEHNTDLRCLLGVVPGAVV